MKEATELLNYMEIDDEKLRKVYNCLSERIKNDDRLRQIIEALRESPELQNVSSNFRDIFSILEESDLLPLVKEILGTFAFDPDVIDNIEKLVLPILFSKD